jgi:hypothetical protein
METLYYTIETVVMWGAVIFSLGLVVYLAYRKYRRMKHRRAYHRHRARRAMKLSDGVVGEDETEHESGHNRLS